MPDIYFTCKTCGKCLVAEDALTGLSTICPDCKTGVIVPTIGIVHPCPHCSQKLKFTTELKGEVVDCTSCKGEVLLPGPSLDEAQAIDRERLVDYACPKCGVEIEAMEEQADRSVDCPNCGAEVHLRRKLHLKLGTDVAPMEEGNQPSGSDVDSGEARPAKWRSLTMLLRYGIVDLVLLALMCVPLQALNGHNFFYVLKLSLTGSRLESSEPSQPRPSDSQSVAPLHSAAWSSGYEVGQSNGKMDRNLGRDEYKDPVITVRAKLAGGYTEGTTDYSDFWEGYHQGYSERR
jgi:DNA-directed RNA polymerase subunit RPC12/RpoP